jgi:hypothetical protein
VFAFSLGIDEAARRFWGILVLREGGSMPIDANEMVLVHRLFRRELGDASDLIGGVRPAT